MSTATQTSPQADAQPPQGEHQSGRLYRGRSVAELIPRIQADLGPEAIVLSRRSGLQGGIGGFFQRPFVEIEAREGGGRIDLYDGPAETPRLDDADAGEFANALAAAGIAITDARPAELKPTADPVAAIPVAPAPEPALRAPDMAVFEPLATARLQASVMPEPLPAAPLQANVVPEPLPTTPSQANVMSERTRTQLAVVKELTATGMEERFALELIDAAGAHVLPFSPRIGLRAAVRIELQRRIPTAAPLSGKGATIAITGPGGSGKTRCISLLERIYGRAETLRTSCAALVAGGPEGALQLTIEPELTTPVDASSARARKALASVRADGVALIDTPAISPADQSQIRALGKLLSAVEPDQVILALPATLSAKAASQLLAAAAALRPNALAITHADETDQLGVAIQAACESGLAPEYMLSGGRSDRALVRLDPASITERLLR